MKIIWQTRAKEGRRQVAAYIRRQFGVNHVKIFRQKVDQVVRMLMQSPNMGSIDPLYADRPVAYRSVIINGLSKMVYRIDDEAIHIVGFWDCRQVKPHRQNRMKITIMSNP